MDFRTDLACEVKEIAGKELEGVESETISDDADITITRVKITDERGEKALGKPVGNYVTIDVPRLRQRDLSLSERVSRCVAIEGMALLPERKNPTYLVVGLGNKRITADSLGPLTVSEMIVTRHILQALDTDTASRMGCVCAMAPGVLGVTGIDTYDVLCGVISRVKPDVLINVDSLAAGKTARIGTTVQISDSGIIPGSGLGTGTARISQETLGIPVLSFGVPLVVYASTLVNDALMGFQEEPLNEPDGYYPDSEFSKLMVTPKEIDILAADCARILSVSLNLMVHPGLSLEDIYGFLR